MQNALEVRNLTKQYEDFRLENVNITLPTGYIMGFIGENGAGKSTTINMILDLVSRDSGEAFVLGQDLHNADKQLKEHIGVVMDECCFPENLCAKEINKVMKKMYKTWDEGRFQAYMQQFSLPDKKPVKDYSRGMKMKLSIAVALSHDSKILILDEATSGLDPIIRNEILDVFLEFIQDEQHSIFLSSHIISDLEKVCDYITFIHKGRIMFSERKDALLEKYGVLKCSEAVFSTVNKAHVKGCRKSSFGVEALVEKKYIPGDQLVEPASIEDIMLYMIKEEK